LTFPVIEERDPPTAHAVYLSLQKHTGVSNSSGYWDGNSCELSCSWRTVMWLLRYSLAIVFRAFIPSRYSLERSVWAIYDKILHFSPYKNNNGFSAKKAKLNSYTPQKKLSFNVSWSMLLENMSHLHNSTVRFWLEWLYFCSVSKSCPNWNYWIDKIRIPTLFFNLFRICRRI